MLVDFYVGSIRSLSKYIFMNSLLSFWHIKISKWYFWSYPAKLKSLTILFSSLYIQVFYCFVPSTSVAVIVSHPSLHSTQNVLPICIRTATIYRNTRSSIRTKPWEVYFLKLEILYATTKNIKKAKKKKENNIYL